MANHGRVKANCFKCFNEKEGKLVDITFGC